jgi:EAL domain-containing protein (putative c-di-GMP-specific phosphodiesterase class I)
VGALDRFAWRAAIEAALADPGQPRLVFQPIVDLRRGVVAGYEALARFTGPPTAAPDVWFAAADRLGVGAQLEARVVRAAITARDTLPEDCFLTVNVSPHLAYQPELADVLTGAGDLSRLVLELTEHVQVEDHQQLTALLDICRAAGATVALDDAGSGYSGLQQLALIRPDLVKIDRALVDHADRDEVKLALAELLGSYAGRLDAALIAEGIEREEELEAFVRLGVPLGQGWLFGRPATTWTELPPALGDRIRALAEDRDQVDRIAGLMERTATVRDDDLSALQATFAADPGLELIAVLDRTGRAVCLVRRQLRSIDRPDDPHVLPVSLRVAASADLADVATRAMTRPVATRFDPVVCGDAYGRHLGIVRPERMMLRLAELRTTGGSVDHPRDRLRLVRTGPDQHRGARR